MKPKGAKHLRSRGAWQVPPYASKLTRRHRDAARVDHSYAEALREQTLYSQRVDARIAGQTWYGGKPCAKCDSIKHRVYDNSCWACQKARTHFTVDDRGRCISRWSASLSRDGYLDRLERQRRERVGEYVCATVGDWHARQYPTGRLAVSCEKACVRGDAPDGQPLPLLPACPYLATAPHGTCPETLTFECSDLLKVAPAVLYALADRNPDFLAVLRWAGWASS